MKYQIPPSLHYLYDQSVFFHNFLISQDLSLVSLRIALSIPELHESEGDLQKWAIIMTMLRY
jgi:hypothetical protein